MQSPSVGEWINKLWHTPMVKFYSVPNHEQAWKNLNAYCQDDNIHSLCEANLYYSNYMTFGKDKTMKSVKRLVISRVYLAGRNE